MRICILAILLSTMCLTGCGHSGNAQPAQPVPGGNYTASYRSAYTPVSITVDGGGFYTVVFQPTGINTAPITCLCKAGELSFTDDGKHAFYLVADASGAVRLDVDHITYHMAFVS